MAALLLKRSPIQGTGWVESPSVWLLRQVTFVLTLPNGKQKSASPLGKQNLPAMEAFIRSPKNRSLVVSAQPWVRSCPHG